MLLCWILSCAGVCRPILCGVGLSRKAEAKVSAYTDDISIFVSCQSDIKVVQKLLEQYERVVGAKINHNKSSGLQLGSWKGVALLGHFS